MYLVTKTIYIYVYDHSPLTERQINKTDLSEASPTNLKLQLNDK